MFAQVEEEARLIEDDVEDGDAEGTTVTIATNDQSSSPYRPNFAVDSM